MKSQNVIFSQSGPVKNRSRARDASPIQQPLTKIFVRSFVAVLVVSAVGEKSYIKKNETDHRWQQLCRCRQYSQATGVSSSSCSPGKIHFVGRKFFSFLKDNARDFFENVGSGKPDFMMDRSFLKNNIVIRSFKIELIYREREGI